MLERQSGSTHKRVRNIGGAGQRGLTMVIALVVVAVLLFVAVVLLGNAFGSVAAENSIRAKIAAFDAAEAGIQQAVEALDKNAASTECGPDQKGQSGATMADGGTYTWCIQANNLITLQPGTVIDHVTHAQISVPSKTVYAWSTGVAQGGGRGVTVEAMIASSNGVLLPSGSVNAGGNIRSRGDVGIYGSATGSSDAVMHADGSILQLQTPHVVQGSTYAANIDQIAGVDGVHSYAAAVPFPASSQVQAAMENAQNAAVAMSPAQSPPLGSAIITGDSFITGDIDLNDGVLTFERGHSVFVNGNLCIHGQAQVINDGATVWVAGKVSTEGGGSYTVPSGSTGTLIVLGTDNGRACPNGGNQYAAMLDSTGTQRVGLVYTPSGSIDLTGSGTLVGVIDAGMNVDLDEMQGGGVQFDPSVPLTIPTYNYKIVSYMEY